MRTERNFQMKKDFFVMMTESKVDKFITSIAMGKPLTEDIFFDSTGTSEFIRFYSSNTYRTITERPEKKSELSINQKMTTITWDFFKNNGDFLAQLITFISKDNGPLEKQFLESFKTEIGGLIEYILTSYILGKDDDIEKSFANNLTSFLDQLLSGQNKSINITSIFTTLRPELSESQLPKDCDVFLENDQFTFQDFRTEANKCYVIKDDKLKFVQREHNNSIFKSEQDITCLDINKLRNTLSALNPQGKGGFFPFNERKKILQIILKFVPAQDKSKIIKSQKAESAYSTVVINKGTHCISLKESTSFGTWISKLVPLATIQHYRKDDIIQIESHKGLLAEEKEISLVDQESKEKFKKDEKYFERLYPTNLKSKLLAKAEEERRKIYQSWNNPQAKIWFLVISRLLFFQKRLEDSNFKPELLPEDPIYQRLREASLDSFWSFAKALEMTEIDESDVISKEGLEEIKDLWEKESKDQKLGWFEAFKKRYPGASLHNGKEIGVLTVVPYNYVCQMRNFSAFPISTDVTKQLKTFNYQLSRDQNSIIFSEVPSILEPQLTLDTIREFHYVVEGNFRAKLTVLYSPRFIEEKDWQQHMKDTCNLVLSSLAKKIFDNLYLFREENEADLSAFITSVLSQGPYNEVNASILLCLTVPQSVGTRRYLVGVGNCLALSFKNEQCTATIGARYSEKGAPILLNSLNKPDNPKALIPSSSIRKRESIRIIVMPDPRQKIFFIPERITRKFLKPNPEFKSKLNFKEYDLDIEKLLSGTEIKDQKMIDNVIKALQNKRREFLDIIENPSMISAWNKIENWLRGQQFKSVEKELKELEKKKSKQDPEDSQLTISNAWNKIGDLVRGLQFQSAENNPQELEEEASHQDLAEESSQLTKFVSLRDKVDKCTTATDLIIALEDFSQQYYEVKEDQALFSQDEGFMLGRLWSIAEIEPKGFPDSKHSEQVALTWTQVRGKYFLYFQGVKDLIAIANPSSSIGCRVELFQHVNAFAEQAFYPLQFAGKKQEALEIQTFKQIICAIGNDNHKIYNVLYQKLNFLDSNSLNILLDLDLSGFWADLVTLLVGTKLINYPNDEHIYSGGYHVGSVRSRLSDMLGLDRSISNFGAITLIPPPVKTKGDGVRKASVVTSENKFEF